MIAILAGPEFAAAAVPMRFLAWIVSLSFLSFQFRFILTALGKAQAYVRLAVPVLLLEACLELALIPRWGYLGACAGLAVGEITFALGGLALCLRPGLGKIDWQPLAGGVLGAAVMGAVLWCAAGAGLPALSAAAAIGLALYVGVCLWSRRFALDGSATPRRITGWPVVKAEQRIRRPQKRRRHRRIEESGK